MSRRKRPSGKQEVIPTRRDVLKIIGSGVLVGAIQSHSARTAKAADSKRRSRFKAHRGAPALAPFRLTEVRLLDGPFLDAQNRDEQYLLKLEADRMLHNFRVNAGLQPRPVYGGWESVHTWADIRSHGHTLGHYLTAASLMYASTGHAEIKKRVDYILGELQECQDAGKTGLICAFPDNDAQFMNMVTGRRSIGVPWYTLHKIIAGLRDAHSFTGSELAKRDPREARRLGR